MARVVSYMEQGENHKPSFDPKLLNPTFFMAEGSLLSNMTMGNAMIMRGREDYFFSWDYSFDHHNEYEMDLGWKHYFNPNISSVVGYRWTNEHGLKDRAFAGVEYRLPFLIYSTATIDSEGDARFLLEKDFQITSRLSASPSLQYDTASKWEYGIFADYMLNAQFSLTAGYESEHGMGLGIKFRF